MNGIEKIIARVDGAAQEQIDCLTAQAQSRAAEIAADYDARAGEETRAILTRGRAAADDRAERLAGAARLEARKMTLAARREMVDAAFDRAQARLLALPREEYIDLLANLAFKAADTGREQVILNPEDRERVGEAAVAAANGKLAAAGREAALTLAEETRPLEGGLVLSGGRVEVNCSLSALLRQQRSQLTGQVAELLFAEG